MYETKIHKRSVSYVASKVMLIIQRLRSNEHVLDGVHRSCTSVIDGDDILLHIS